MSGNVKKVSFPDYEKYSEATKLRGVIVSK